MTTTKARRYVWWGIACLLAYLSADLLIGGSPANAQGSIMQRAVIQGQSVARDSAQACYLRAAQLAAAGRYAQAIAELRRAMEYLPNEPQLRVDMAVLLTASGDKEGAIRELQSLANQATPYPPAVIQLGDMRLAEGDSAGATSYYRRLISGANPYPPAFLRMGDIAQEQGKRAEAVRYYRQACQADSSFVEAWLSLGSILVIMDRHHEALAAFDRAVAIAPDEEMATELRRLAIQRKQDYEEGTAAGHMRARMIVARTLQEAQNLRQQVLAGADFIALAKRYSIDPTSEVGGDLGFFAEGELIPVFEQTVKALRPGQISEVVQLPSGYAIILRVN